MDGKWGEEVAAGHDSSLPSSSLARWSDGLSKTVAVALMEGAKSYFNKTTWGPQMTLRVVAKPLQVVALADRKHQLHLQQGHEPYDPKCEECIHWWQWT